MLHAKCCKQCYIEDNLNPDSASSKATVSATIDNMICKGVVFCKVAGTLLSLTGKAPTECTFRLEQLVYDNGLEKEKQK